MSSTTTRFENVASGLLMISLGIVAFKLMAAQILLAVAALMWLRIVATDTQRSPVPAFFWLLVGYAGWTIVSALATANYEARKFGIYTPMPTAQARRLCPKLIVLPGHYDLYEEFSNGMFAYERVSTVAPTPGVPLVDPEALDLPRRGYDLIVSLFDLDVVDDVPGFLRAPLRTSAFSAVRCRYPAKPVRSRNGPNDRP